MGESNEQHEQDDVQLTRGLSARQKQKLVIILLVLCVFTALGVAALIQGMMKGEDVPESHRIGTPKERALTADPETARLTEKNKGNGEAFRLTQAEATLAAERQKNDELTAQIVEAHKKHDSGAVRPTNQQPQQANPASTATQGLADRFTAAAAKKGFPPGNITAEQLRHDLGSPSGKEEQKPPLPPPEPDWGGGWLTVSAEKAAPASAKLKKKKITLPRGMWTKGVVIGGAYAPTAAKALSQAKPIIIRVEADAVLPSDQRENWIEGCTIIGAANGEHGIHRGAIWLTGISCTSNDKKSYISQDIDGWVVGPDGREGIQGEVVSYYHETIGYQAIAEGAKATGEILKAQSMTTTLPPLGGQQQTITGDKMGQAMGGAAAAGAFGSMADIYSSLTKEKMPYVDVSPGMDVTLFLKKDVELELKSRCIGEEEECARDSLF